MTGGILQHDRRGGDCEVRLLRRKVGASRLISLLVLTCLIAACATVQPVLASAAPRTVARARTEFESSPRGRAQQSALAIAAKRHGLPPGIPVPSWATKPGGHANLTPSPAALTSADQTGSHQGTGMHARDPIDDDDDRHGGGSPHGPNGSEEANLAEIREGEVPPVRYLGGVVQHAPTVHVLFWGNNWNYSGAETKIALMNLYSNLSGSAYQGIFTQYFDKSGYISSSVTANYAVDTRVSAPTNVTESSVEHEVEYAETLWSHNLETQYAILLAPGSTYDAEFAEGYCAYHDVAPSGAIYSFVPYEGDEPWKGENVCTWYGHGDPTRATTSLASHEYAESATDPLWDTAPAWRNRASFEGEISDLCATPGEIMPNGITVQGQYDDHKGACTIEDKSPPHVMGLTEPASAVTANSATLNGTINPENQATNYYFEYGPTTAYGTTTPVTYAGANLENIAVSRGITGLQLEHVYHYRIVAENASGKTSGEDHTVIPSLWTTGTLSGGTHSWRSSWLNDIACPTEGACMTVGYYYENELKPEPNQALSYQLVGGSWVRRAVPQSEEEGWPELRAVSCPGSTSACIAVGEGQVLEGAGHYMRRPLIVRWNGSTWTQEHVALPPETLSAEFSDVSCVESLAKKCLAVGARKTTAGAWVNYSAELINGTWVSQSTPAPAESTESVMEGVSCSYTACRAVGWFNRKGTHPLTAVHTSGGWQLQTPEEGWPSGGYLSDISCLANESCVAVGHIYGANKGPAAYTWNGSSWQTPISLGTPTTKEAFFEGVSCQSVERCVAVGGNFSALGSSMTFTARLDAKGWSERTTPRESEVAPNWLEAVSCGSRSCTTVGLSKATDSDQRLIETLAGGPPLLEGLKQSAVKPEGNSGSFTLSGKVDPNGYETHVRFEWGTQSEYEEGKYGHTVAAGLFGAGTGNQAVETTVSGLERGKTYRYRLVGENVAGTNEEKGGEALEWRDWAFPQLGSPYVLSGSASEATAGAGHLSISSSVVGTATSFECAVSTTGSVVAGGTGSAKIGLSGCTVSKPAKCEIPPASLEAKTELISAGGTTYEKFVPANGTKFGVVVFSGALCPLSGAEVGVKGSFAGLPSTSLAVERSLSFSPTINTAAGASFSLTTQPATDEGSISEHLSGKTTTGTWRSLWEGTHGNWEMQSVTPSFLKSSESIIVAGGPVNLHFSSSWGSISIGCTGVGVEGATISPGGAENPNKFRLTGCTATEPKGCTVPSTITFGGVSATLQVVNGQVYEKFVPTEAGFFWLSFGGSTCSLLGLEWRIGGSFSAAGYAAPFKYQTLEFSAASNAATGSALTFGTSGSGSFTGSFKQELSGVNAGRPWGAF